MIVIKPVKESVNNLSIKISATNPTKDDEEIGTKIITAKFQYPSVTPTISFENSTGKYSKLENGTLYIGDGETVNLKFGIAEEKTTAFVDSVRYSATTSNPHSLTNASNSLTSDSVFAIGDNPADDVVDMSYRYRINALYVPYKFITEGRWTGSYDGKYDDDENETYNDPEAHKVMETVVVGKNYVNWKEDLRWRCWYKKNGREYDDFMGLTQVSTYQNTRPSSGGNWLGYFYDEYPKDEYHENSGWGREEDVSYRNTVMSEEEFLNCAWLYCPGTVNKSKTDVWVTYADIHNGTLANGPYGSGAEVEASPHIMTQNVTATRELFISDDDSITDAYEIGKISIYISHLGSTTKSSVEIPVIYEVRKCPK